jgi:hypothetical protein
LDRPKIFSSADFAEAGSSAKESQSPQSGHFPIHLGDSKPQDWQ